MAAPVSTLRPQHPDLQRLLRHGNAKHRVAVTIHHSVVLEAGAEAAPKFVSAAISAIGVPIVLASSQDDVASVNRAHQPIVP